MNRLQMFPNSTKRHYSFADTVKCWNRLQGSHFKADSIFMYFGLLHQIFLEELTLPKSRHVLFKFVWTKIYAPVTILIIIHAKQSILSQLSHIPTGAL